MVENPEHIYENSELVIVSKLTSELVFDDVAHSEHVPASEDILDLVSLPVTANIVILATKEWIESTKYASTFDVLKADQKGL